MATVRAIGTNQDAWNFLADDAGIGTLTAKEGYAHVVGTLSSATGKHVLQLTDEGNGLALKFFGTDAAEERADVRVWGLSEIPDPGDLEYIGIYLGEFQVELGSTSANSGVFTGNNHFFCWLNKVTEDAGPTPPEPTVIGGERYDPGANPPLELSATLLIPTFGLKFIIVEIKPTASGGMATVGVLWRVV